MRIWRDLAARTGQGRQVVELAEHRAELVAGDLVQDLGQASQRGPGTLDGRPAVGHRDGCWTTAHDTDASREV